MKMQQLFKGNPWYEVVWLYDSEFEGRQFPLVYLANGRPGYVITQYIYDLMARNFSFSMLELHVRSLCHLYAFTCARYGFRFLTETESANLVANFLDAKIYGTDEYCTRRAANYTWMHDLGLHWKPLIFSQRDKGSTIRDYVDAFAEFDKWQSVHHDVTQLNPKEKYFMNAWEMFLDFKRRSQWDMNLHLHKSRSHYLEKHQNHIREKLDKTENGRKNIKTPKKSPPNRIVELVDNAATNVRDKLLLLIMLGGSLRRSEPLHLFRSDVEGMDIMGQAKIRLADPEVGMVEWLDESGIKQSGTRAKYFRDYWANANGDIPLTHPLRHLAPRTKLDRRNQGLHSGFKSMTLSAGEQSYIVNGVDARDYDVHYLWWCDPRIGAYWYELFKQYENNYLLKNPFTGESVKLRHPWLFIIIEPGDNYGMPLSITAVKALWRRLKKRLGITYRLGWHSLRHYFGYYCASVLKLPIEQVQVLMHHGFSTSTEVYYHLNQANVRQAITTAHLQGTGRGDFVHNLTSENSNTPKFPTHWTNTQYKLWTEHLNQLKPSFETLPTELQKLLKEDGHE